jgi:hypothetical protein
LLETIENGYIGWGTRVRVHQEISFMSGDYSMEDSGSSRVFRPILFNILTIFFLILTCLCPGLSLAIFASPHSGFNPLPPRTATPRFIPPTNTPTPMYEFPPTWTPTGTPTQTDTPESRTETPFYTATYNPNPGATEGAFFPFRVEGGGPAYLPSPKGCAWLGVAGTVFDVNRTPINNLLVDLDGKFAGESIQQEEVTRSLNNTLGGEFEFRLADKPTLVLNSLWIQLFDANRTPLSEKLEFNTYEGCDRNLVQINFVQISP